MVAAFSTSFLSLVQEVSGRAASRIVRVVCLLTNVAAGESSPLLFFFSRPLLIIICRAFDLVDDALFVFFLLRVLQAGKENYMKV